MPFTQQLEANGSRGGAMLGQFLMSYGLNELAKADEAKELVKSEAKQAKALRTLLGEGYPDEKPKFDAMGLDELNGLYEGRKFKDALASQSANTARTQASTARDQFALSESRATSEELARGMSQLPGLSGPRQQGIPAGMMGGANFQTMPPPAQGPQMQRAIQGIMAQNPRAAGAIAEALKQQQAVGGLPMTPQAWRHPETGEPFAFHGNQIMRSSAPGVGGAGAATATNPETPASLSQVVSAQKRYNELTKEIDKAMAPLTSKGGKMTRGDWDKAAMLYQQRDQLAARLGLKQQGPAGSAKEAIAGGSADDPLGYFQ